MLDCPIISMGLYEPGEAQRHIGPELSARERRFLELGGAYFQDSLWDRWIPDETTGRFDKQVLVLFELWFVFWTEPDAVAFMSWLRREHVGDGEVQEPGLGLVTDELLVRDRSQEAESGKTHCTYLFRAGPIVSEQTISIDQALPIAETVRTVEELAVAGARSVLQRAGATPSARLALDPSLVAALDPLRLIRNL